MPKKNAADQSQTSSHLQSVLSKIFLSDIMEGSLPAHQMRKIFLMRQHVRILLTLLLISSPAMGDTPVLKVTPEPKVTPELKPLDEVWEAAYVDVGGVSTKIGHIHLTSKIVEAGDKKFLRTTKELRFVVNRGANQAEMKSDVTCDENAAGLVSGINAKIWLGKENVLELKCNVTPENIISIQAAGQFNFNRQFKWDPACIGLAGEQTFLKNKKAKPGDNLTYRYFEPQVTNYVTVHVVVKDLDEVVLPGGLKRKLLKVIATPDPLKLEGDRKLQLPPATFWADPISLETVKTQMDITELGIVTLLRTSKLAALASNGQMPDLMKRQSIYLKTNVPDIHDRESVTYRITFAGDALPKELVSTDNRQSIKNIEGKTFDLVVTARHTPPSVKPEDKVDEQFLKSNYFINCDDATVQELAKRATGLTTDPWQQAKKIESFVRGFMKPVDYSEAMAPADHVAKTAQGDCTEYAMLTAAMCRVKGIPSRTAIGLVYVDDLLGKPGLAFHMWTEVLINGEWMGIDATRPRPRGAIGPGHIKITDHSWSKVISFTPLLPVKGFIMANPTIEVVGK